MKWATFHHLYTMQSTPDNDNKLDGKQKEEYKSQATLLFNVAWLPKGKISLAISAFGRRLSKFYTLSKLTPWWPTVTTSNSGNSRMLKKSNERFFPQRRPTVTLAHKPFANHLSSSLKSALLLGIFRPLGGSQHVANMDGRNPSHVSYPASALLLLHSCSLMAKFKLQPVPRPDQRPRSDDDIGPPWWKPTCGVDEWTGKQSHTGFGKVRRLDDGR